MLYRRFRRKPIYIHYYFRPLSTKKKILMSFCFIFVLFFIFTTIFYINVRPVVVKLTESAVTDVVVLAINDVISNEISTGDLDYEKLITLIQDENGNVTALITNMAIINTLQTKITDGVTRSVKDKILNDMDIPIGNVIGGTIFSGRGPSIPIKILSVTDVRTKFTNSFSAAGINQTRHKIMLEINVTIDMLVPGCTTSTTVDMEVAVAETVIVGDVPNFYTDSQG